MAEVLWGLDPVDQILLAEDVRHRLGEVAKSAVVRLQGMQTQNSSGLATMYSYQLMV